MAGRRRSHRTRSRRFTGRSLCRGEERERKHCVSKGDRGTALGGLVVAEPTPMRNVNRSRARRLVLVAALVPLSACATPPAYQAPQRTQAVRAVETPRRTDPPEPLSPAARALLKERMA